MCAECVGGMCFSPTIQDSLSLKKLAEKYINLRVSKYNEIK